MHVGRKVKLQQSDYLMCDLSLVALYTKPSEGAPLVSQILFGETAQIISRKNKQWAKIITDFDGTEAWADLRQLSEITPEMHKKFSTNFSVALEVCQVLMNNDVSFPVLIASSLPEYDGMVFKTAAGKYVYNGQASSFQEVKFGPDIMEKLTRRFVNAPFINGGRSVFGLDKMALVQLIYKCAGVALPRTLDQMLKFDFEVIHFIEQASPGDIAFFINKNEEIDHLGIVLSDGQVLHVAEKARIDKLDHEGIYNKETKKYSHKLRYIGRVPHLTP
jgi:cell wall-associated NlpC family hydrolase